MNTATQIGLAIFAIIVFGFLAAGWFAVCWLTQDHLEARYKRCLPFSGLALYLSPVVGIGLICLCYGLAVQPKTTEPKEEAVTEFRTSEDRRLAEHMFHRDMRRLIKHYRTTGSIDPDLVDVINDYERLHGEVQLEEDDW